ncbi:MAG: hypothetical protein LQ338_001356 [Usnochroma carphineum]|nr:MAG: hypothetical protein LQ338_001356 [Usnochroma carphineum]
MPSSPAQDDASPTKLAQASVSSLADQVEAKKCANLEAKIATLEAQMGDTKVKLDEATAKLKNPDASQTVKNYIKLLREYNDIRDIGTSLMGMIADNRRIPMKRVYEEFDVDEKD